MVAWEFHVQVTLSAEEANTAYHEVQPRLSWTGDTDCDSPEGDTELPLSCLPKAGCSSVSAWILQANFDLATSQPKLSETQLGRETDIAPATHAVLCNGEGNGGFRPKDLVGVRTSNQ